MRMEIGTCHRRYPVADFYAEATARFAPKVKLDKDGNLEGYVAGLPFPPEQIAAGDPNAAVKWAWNFQHRYRGAGPVGNFRILDLPGRLGTAQTYEGEVFFLATGHRADLDAGGEGLGVRRRRPLLRAVQRAPPGLAADPSREGGRALAGARRHLRVRAGDAEAAPLGQRVGRWPVHAAVHGVRRVGRRPDPD